jgi:PTS system nitrogen regulatory IIA component
MSSLLLEILDPRLVVLELREGTSAEAILELAELLRNHGHVRDYYKFADAVMEREGRSSTNTGQGVAFPHARTDLVQHISLAIGRSQAGLQFGLAKELVHLVFLFAVPKQMVTDYLICVGAVARAVREKAKRDGLMAVETAETFIEQLRIGALLVE